MAGRFLLIFFLARILPPEELGAYGLLTATMGYAMYFLGLDFYTYSGRAMLHAEQKLWPAMLRDQAVLFACSYTLVLPLFGLIFVAGLLPVKYALVFFILLTVEHLSQELNRLYIISGKPLAAGFFLFIRSGAWCYALVAVYLGGFVSVKLQTVLWFWVVADTLVVAGGICLLRKLPWDNLTPEVNWAWIFQGVRVAGLLLIGTLAIRGVLTLDRYFVEAFSSLKMLGVYTFYTGICFSLLAFVDAVVFSFRYPALVSLYKAGQFAAFISAKQVFAHQTLVAVTVLALAAGLLIVPVVGWIDKPIYLQYLPVYFVLLAASIFYVIGYIPHYVLYAMGQDHSIIGSQLAGFVSFIILSLILGPMYKMVGVASALLISVIVVGVLKQWKIVTLSKMRLVDKL
jgi:O-antigen/teichoic acid export membrane protein